MIQQRTNNTSWKRNTKEYIVLHHTATWHWTIAWVLNAFKRSGSLVSAHYVIDTNWDLYKFNSDNDILWHAWISEWEWKTGLNKYSIWIEIIGPLPWFTTAQKKTFRDLTKSLMLQYNIPSQKIIRHKDIAPNRKVDINDSFWNDDYNTREDFQRSFDLIKTYQFTEDDKVVDLETVILMCSTLNKKLHNSKKLIKWNSLKQEMSDVQHYTEVLAKSLREAWF